MEKEPEPRQDQSTATPETPPPFAPDPDIVTLREREAKDPKAVWRDTQPK